MTSKSTLIGKFTGKSDKRASRGCIPLVCAVCRNMKFYFHDTARKQNAGIAAVENLQQEKRNMPNFHTHALGALGFKQIDTFNRN
jgi:hypothetical protein